MKFNHWLQHASKLCAEIGPGDGVDPRLLARGRERKPAHHKALQLSKEAKRVLSLFLAGEVADPLLQFLQVIDVSPESDGQFLRVTVAPSGAKPELSEKAVVDALVKIQGGLRSAIAHSVKRKRVPALKFRYVGFIEEGEV